MNFKKIKSFLAIILIVATFIMPLNVFAYSDYIVAGGENIGLKVNSKGVIVAGFYDINGVSPGLEAKLKKGDMIVKVSNNSITNINEFVNEIECSNKKELKISYIRDDKENSAVLKLIEDNNTIKTGLYIKDGISAIGTLTYIDPETKLFGSLGHEVIESSSGQILEVKDGQIYNSKVTSIEKSVRGEPGSKNAIVDPKSIYGNITENTKSGIFGSYTNDIDKNKLYKVGTYQDIKLGQAKMITVLDGEEKKEYSINILKINKNDDNKNILFEITDKELLNKTGGIIQGMSGSPIIQNDLIIGAVTNVVVNNPKRGYGILITSMLKEAEN